MKKQFLVLFVLYVLPALAQEGSYSYYNYFQDEPIVNGYLTDGYYVGGPFRVNGSINLYSSSPGRDNDPFFYSLTLSSDYFVYGMTQAGPHISIPHYENLWIEPYEHMEQGSPWFNLGADLLPFGSDQVEWMLVRAAAENYGLYLTAAEVPDGSRILLEDGQLTVKTDEYSAPIVYSLASLAEQVVWIENSSTDKLYLKGHPDSQGFSEEITIGTQGSIYFAGPLEYNGASAGMLGLISVFGNGIIADKPVSDWTAPFSIETNESFFYSASILLLEGKFQAQNIVQPSPKVDFTLFGGIQMQEEGYTSTPTAGFNLLWEYDARLLNQSPPWYPQYEISGVETPDSPKSELELSASCNPFSSSIILTISEPGTIKVFDFTGRIVARTFTDSVWAWNGSLFPDGVYTVVVTGEGGACSSLRLIKI